MPSALFDIPDWSRAACLGADVNLFFPPSPDLAVVNCAKAKQICAGCMMTDECLEYGLEEPYGIWGGMNHEERKALLLEREYAPA